MRPRTYALAASLIVAAAVAQAQPTPPPAGPSTSPAEGTAADRTQPGETPTQSTQQNAPQQSQDPRPATSQTEGTAADRTAPSPDNPAGASQQGELMGTPVVSSANARIGHVVDVVFDASNQPTFVVIESEGEAVAVPYAAATSMKRADKIVIEQSRLQGAPKLEEGAWRDPASKRWQQESTRYWERG
jgi:hypothetical protein